MKNKTELEEVAKEFANNSATTNYEEGINVGKYQGFINGAKWQQQQDKKLYSEEDIKHAFFSGCHSERKIKPRIKCWEEFIEQLKKD
jgi:hypothetical protein